jgi:amino acid transporter
MILIDTPNGNLLFGYISETGAIMIFAICLVFATIGIRWFFKKYEETTKPKDKVEGKR